MRNEPGRSDAVTYIGPRSFVIGFAVICGVLFAIGFGATRITEGLEEAAPLAATRNATVPSLPTTMSAVPSILSTVMRARRSALEPTTLHPAARRSAFPITTGAPAAVQVNVPIAAKTPIALTTKTTIAAITKAPIPAIPKAPILAVTKAPIPAITKAPILAIPIQVTMKAPIPVITKTHIPTRTESSPAVPAGPGRVKPVVSRLVLAPQPVRTRTPRVPLTEAPSHPAPAALLVPFKTPSALTASSALEPRSAGGAPLIINPAPSSAAPP